MRPLRSDPTPTPEHGSHTLRVWDGIVVGVFGHDVFVELGPRMQGVIDARRFEAIPRVGDKHRYTLRGLEEGLWSLALSDERSLDTWEQMELGSVVHARAIRVAPGGLETKIGPLHAFLPKSHTGLARDEKVDVLVGRQFAVEVIEVDPERQRVTVSRKLVLQRERESQHAREVDQLHVGEVVHGRVVRIEDYGVFVRFGRGLEGLVHVSNLCHEHVAHPSQVVQMGQSLELKVLHVKRGGKHIGLGLKQLVGNPWRELEKTVSVGQIVEGVVTRVLAFGAFVAIRAGVEGLVPASEAGIGRDQRIESVLEPGQKLSARVLAFDLDRERLSLSLVHPIGTRLEPDEAENVRSFEDLSRANPPPGASSNLGNLLRSALDARRRA